MGIRLSVLDSLNVSYHANNPHLMGIFLMFRPLLSSLSLTSSFPPLLLCPACFSFDLIFVSTFSVGFYLSNYVATHLWRERRKKKTCGMLGGWFFSNALFCAGLPLPWLLETHKRNFPFLFSIQSPFQHPGGPSSRGPPAPKSPDQPRLGDKTPQALFHYEATIGSNAQKYTRCRLSHAAHTNAHKGIHTRSSLLPYLAFSVPAAWPACAPLRRNPSKNPAVIDIRFIMPTVWRISENGNRNQGAGSIFLPVFSFFIPDKCRVFSV